MNEKVAQLGALQAVYGSSPVFLQRAAITAVLSFVFFLSMLIIFSLVQNFVYFLLATAFLIVELVTLFIWISQKRNEFQMFENGFIFRKQSFLWREIAAVSRENVGQKIKYAVETRDGEKIFLTAAIYGVENIAARIKAEISKKKL